MFQPKFLESHRKRVVKYFEDRGLTLGKPVPSMKKYFIDQATGQGYLIVGESGDWHGIPEIVFQIENARKQASANLPESQIVVARLLKDRMQVYQGSLMVLIKNRSKLTRNQQGDYQFDTVQLDDRLRVKKMGDFSLKCIGQIDLE